MADNTSRLLTNSASVRNNLETRNLYTIDASYPLDPTTTTKIVNTISNISSTLMPFRSNDLRNSAIGRLITDKSPITEIGLQCLGTQLAYNAASKLEKKYLPTISLGNLFDKNSDTKLFTWKKNYSLTKNIFGSQTGIIGGVEKIINVTEGIYPSQSPFQKDTTNDELLENTGSAVISIRNSNLNRNLYKSKYSKTSLNFNSIDQKGISKSISATYRFFDPIYNKFFTETVISNDNMATAYNLIIDITTNGVYEYGSEVFNSLIFGITIKNNEEYGTITDSMVFSSKVIDDSTSDSSMNTWLNNNKTILQWDYNINFSTISNIESIEKLGNKGGLIEYTRNLMIASKGKYVAINKKIFNHNDSTYGFNGSAILEAPSTALPEFKNKLGLRQHTFKDPYNKFSKAIRFIGNSGYGGNENSVIYETVLPRMHPITGSEVADNTKRLMFSIENLAFEVIKGNKYGIIVNSENKDEIIPLTEIGAFGGRVMWFPPYDLSIVETSEAKSTSTVFLGRNEPIYNYESSERSATITFKLIADYPSNLHDFKDKTEKEIAEFFAFGGKPNNRPKKEVINPLFPQLPEAQPKLDILRLYFPNNEPKLSSNIDTAIQSIIDSEYGIGGNSDGVNNDILLSSYIDVYNYIGIDDKLNEIIADPNSNISIDLIGNTTKLYKNTDIEKQYNIALSDRRCEAVKKYIISRLEALEIKNYTFNKKITLGSANAPNDTAYPPRGSNETDIEFNNRIASIVNSSSSISSRNVEIYIYKSEINNSTTVTKNDTQVNNTKDVVSENIYEKTFNKILNADDIETHGMSENNESIKEDYFMPVYHSQSPEEYHRRLTFLQQCTRQGGAQRTEQGDNNIRNSVFGRQPIAILRIGDFFYTKIIINSINFSYKDGMWDLNPEGFGLQPLMCDITMNIKIIGGQSLKGPIDLLQNAISFNYYANSTYTNKGIYTIPTKAQYNQYDNVNKKDETKYDNNGNIITPISKDNGAPKVDTTISDTIQPLNTYNNNQNYTA